MTDTTPTADAVLRNKRAEEDFVRFNKLPHTDTERAYFLAGHLFGTAPETIAALATPAPQPGYTRMVRHKKRGTLYEVIGEGRVQVTGLMPDDAPVTLYRSLDDGGLWCRDTAEFNDGRFEEVAAPAAQGWSCGARRNISADTPQDCDWPVYGCDPGANKVIEALEESGLLPAVQGDAEPVGYVAAASVERLQTDPDECACVNRSKNEYFDTPLYTAPRPASDDARDAGRYRVLRALPDHAAVFEMKPYGPMLLQGDRLDAGCDAAIARQAAASEGE